MRRPNPVVTLACVVAAWAAASFTQALSQTDDSPDYKACQSAAKSAVDDARCAAAEYRRFNDILNKVYRQALAQSSPARRKRLRSEQQAWVKTTDATCKASGDEHMGSSQQLLDIDGCYIGETDQRIQILVAQIKR